jgi:hypothetical protein
LPAGRIAGVKICTVHDDRAVLARYDPDCSVEDLREPAF